jgi:hypothetical protein
MMGETSVRAYQHGDETAVEAIMWAAVNARELEGTTARDIEMMIVRLPADPEGRLLATDDGEVVGLLAPDWQFLAVHPRMWKWT